MSSRIRSEFGTLGQRLGVAGQAGGVGESSGRAGVPCHVWARLVDGGVWLPGLLVRWEQGEDGAWWGDVAVVGESGVPGLQLVPSDQLRPVAAPPPAAWQ